MAFVQLASGTSTAELQSYQSQMYTMESSQPEQTEMELILDMSFPSWITWANPAQHIADMINLTLALKGTDKWPGNTTWAYATGTNQVSIKWVKAPIWVDIVIGAVIAATAYFVLNKWVYGKISSSSTGGTSLLGTANLWAWALIAVGAFAAWKEYIAYKEEKLRDGDG